MFTIFDEPELADPIRAREVHKVVESDTDIAARILADAALRYPGEPLGYYGDLYSERLTAERRAGAVWHEARRRMYAKRPSTSAKHSAMYAENAATTRRAYYRAVAR